MNYRRLAIDTDASVTAFVEAYNATMALGIEPDTVFVCPDDYPYTKEIVDELYTKRGIALNRVFCSWLPPGTWILGKNSPLFGFGSPGA